MTTTTTAFPKDAIEAFAAAYPDRHQRMTHNLVGHPLFTREAIAALAERHPQELMEYNLGTMPIGINPEDTPQNGLTVAETIRTIEENKSWIVIKNVERDPAYGRVFEEMLAELEPIVSKVTGAMEHKQCYLFFTSPGSITPFHMDPEHNILLQIEGPKTMNVFPVADPEMVPPEQSESFHAGGHRNLKWDEKFLQKMDAVLLQPGEAVLMPVKAPHYVQNGDQVSISFSITWRSERSVAEGELHSFNRMLRAKHLPLVNVGHEPEKQKLARVGYRVMRKLGA